MSRPIIYAVLGRIGSGKTTHAQKLAKEKGAVFFSMDQTLANLGVPVDSYQKYERLYPGVNRILRELAFQILKQGVPVVFDYGVNRPKGRASLQTFAHDLNAELEIHHLIVPSEECRRRVHERNRLKTPGIFSFELTDEDFDFIAKVYIPPTEEEGLKVVSVEWEG